MNDIKTNTLIIQTPEGIRFPLMLASPLVRFLAWLIDWLCISAAISFIGQAMTIFQIISQDLFQGIMVLLYFFLSVLYPILTEWFWKGQTLGKRLFKLKVMDVQGLQLQFGQIVIRNLLRAIDIMPVSYMAGGIAALISPKCQRIGDIAANTIVVRTPKIEQPEFKQVQSDKFNSFKSYPHLCNRLRYGVPPELAGIALQALLRRNMIESNYRIKLFKKIAGHLKKIITFPQDAVDGLSDEQYIKNTIEIIFNSENNKP